MIRILFLSVLLASAPVSAALPGADALAKLIMSQFDTNSDESLDAGEWQTGAGKGFREMDDDRDGDIAPAEVDALRGAVAGETDDLTATLVVALIKRALFTLDADGNGSVSQKEYGAVTGDVFKKLDADQNHSISQEELLQLPARLIGL